MTTYAEFEVSSNTGEPIEGYEFVGTFNTYRYTSHDTQVTINGQVFYPVDITRNTISTGVNDEDTLSLDITTRADLPLVTEYIGYNKPPDLTFTLYRTHVGASDFVIAWTGKATAFSVRGSRAGIRIPNPFGSILSVTIPNYCWQRSCNHVLYSTPCGLSRASYLTNTTVVSVGSSEIVIADTSDSLNSLRGGEIVNLTKGERRYIMANNSGLITINYPFKDCEVGDTVELTQGCDHSLSTCFTKFNNAANYGGFPYIPTKDPSKGAA